jgi:hypothetical protein
MARRIALVDETAQRQAERVSEMSGIRLDAARIFISACPGR